jgi:hypothetical protein
MTNVDCRMMNYGMLSIISHWLEEILIKDEQES